MKTFLISLFAFVLSLFGMSAFAVPPATLSDLTSAISFTDVGLGILAVAALLVGVYVIKKGAVMVIHAVKGL